MVPDLSAVDVGIWPELEDDDIYRHEDDLVSLMAKLCGLFSI